MKTCKLCNIEKEHIEFRKHKIYKDGYNAECKLCEYDKLKKYDRTKQGLSRKIYSAEKQNSKRRGHKPPQYSLNEFREWVFMQDKFHILFKYWEENNYKKDLIPSVDRIDDFRGYSFDNIQIMTSKENSQKYYDAIRDGDRIHIAKPHKPVSKFTKNGELIEKFISLKDAERKTGIAYTQISKVCKGDGNTAGGFKWRYG